MRFTKLVTYFKQQNEDSAAWLDAPEGQRGIPPAMLVVTTIIFVVALVALVRMIG